MPRICSRCSGRMVGYAVAVVAGAYAAVTGRLWLGYGRPDAAVPPERDVLLDEFLPHYDVVERLQVNVNAPADVTFRAAEGQTLMQSRAVRLVFRLRQLVMGSARAPEELPLPLIDQAKVLGWRELARLPGREVIMGAVTQPWKADVTFRGLPPTEFAGFKEPGYVKIAWTLRAHPLPNNRSTFFSETRAVATDPVSRKTFRNYWALAAPGIWLIRRLSSGPMRRQAEREIGGDAARYSPVGSRW